MTPALCLRLGRYSLVLGAVVLAVPVALFLSFGGRPPASLFLVAVVVGAWFGMAEGLAATVLGSLALAFFLMPPLFSLGVGPDDAARLAAFNLAGIVVSWAVTARRRREERARARDEQKTRFLAILAHELRTPLGAILHAADALRQAGANPSAIGPAREVVESQARVMRRLVADLEDAAALDRGKLRLLTTAVDFRNVAVRAVEAARHLFEERGVRLSAGMPSDPLPLAADAERLVQAILNLLTNAARYTDRGGRAWLTLGREGRNAVLGVWDNGVGFGAGAAAHLFDPFVQESGGRGGLGLGLSLVRGIVELHGGTVEAHSDGVGRGSEFTIRLPLVGEPAA